MDSSTARPAPSRAALCIPHEVLATSKLLCSDLSPAKVHRAIAAWALHHCGAYDTRALFRVSALARLTWLRMREVLEHAWGQQAEQDASAGVLVADAIAADFLQGIGPTGAEFADELRCKSIATWQAFRWGEKVDIWRNWHRPEPGPTTMRVARAVAVSLWKDVVEPDCNRLTYPAVAREVLDVAIGSLWQGQSNTVWCHRLFRWIVHEGFAMRLAGDQERTITVPHGLTGLAGLLGANSKSSMVRLGEALASMQAASAVDGAAWIQVHNVRAARGREASLRLTPNDCLLPGYASSLPNRSANQRRRKALVPVPLDMPPPVGRCNEAASQAVLELRFLAHARGKSTEFARRQTLHLADGDWVHLLSAAEVPGTLASAVQQAWLDVDAKHGAHLERMGKNTYKAGPALALAARFICQSAELERAGRAAQKCLRPRYRPASKRA